MFLKRLELSGFKSFPDKLKLDFLSGVTAVVGPNGSGKSNIADAVRWVMGEQSAKSLRGSKMEDVIFSGTEHRRPHGYAEVQMLIDNSNNLLPVAFTEVNVTRRVFRSGESEYLLNGSPCRMRDIHSLFMDTGVGREGYSIIGQGRVDEILSTRSEDRRHLFEEAAGIVKYKSRRQEALSKLEAEKHNLLRVDDLIEELNAQLSPMAAQAEQAKLYLNLRDQYKIIHVNLFLEEAEKAEAEQEKTKELIANLSTQSESAEKLLAESQQSLHNLKEKEIKAEASYKELNKEIIARVTEIEKSESNKRLTDRIEVEIKRHEDAIRQKQSEKVAAIAESEKIQKAIQTTKEALTQIEANHASLEKQVEELQEANSKYKLLLEMERGHEGYYASVKAVLRRKDQDPAFGNGIYGTVSELLKVPSAYEYAISVSLGGSAQNILTAKESDAQRAIAYLKSSKTGRATFLPVAAMRPRNITAEMNNLLKEPGVAGLASSLVSYDSIYAPVFGYLLGNVFVVDHLTRAIELSKQYRQSYRLVTLDGDLISPGGSMTGGSQAKQSTELISRNRQISELAGKIEILTRIRKERDNSSAQLTDNKIKLSNLAQSLQTARANSARLTIELESMQSEKATLEAEVVESGTSEDTDSLRIQLEKQQNELTATEEEMSNLRETIAKVELTEREQMEIIARLSREAARLEIRYEQYEADSRRLHNEVWESYSLTYQSAQEFRKPDYSHSFLRREEKSLKAEIAELGNVNVGAIEAYTALKQRHEFLSEQRDDILNAEAQLQEIIGQLTEQMEQQFSLQFAIMARHFNDVFKEMFGGGRAGLAMSDPENVLESGIEITAQPPGKNLQSLSLLSGGERALTAIALLFGILRMKPSPFCILDEIESALDDANVLRFANFLKEYADGTQFVVITHRKGTMESADTLYGVTMQELGVSKMVSVDFR